MSDDVTLYLGDCLDVMRGLPDGCVDAVVADPPYGCARDCDYTRFTKQTHDYRTKNEHAWEGIAGDDSPFDPRPWLRFPKVIMWGYQFWADQVPLGTILVWKKRSDNALGTFCSDAELAWQKGGHGVYMHLAEWSGFRRIHIGEPSMHPTQKPVSLMRWCIERVTEPGQTVLDPFMGSGTTGVACIQTGRRFIGIEIDPTYYAIAEKRIAEARAQLPLPLAQEAVV